ncbi:MAG TPA: apolipoprotein N-acyltransferase [Candidatus Binatia bacterium]
MSRGRAPLLTLLSAGLCALAFPPVGAWPLAWVGLVPLLVVLRDVSAAGRLGLGVLWTFAIGLGVGTWMPGAVAGYFQQPLAIGVALFLIVTGLMAAPYYAAFALAYAPLVRGRGAAAPLLAAAAWAGAELARGRLLNGTLVYVGNSPWATLGYSQAPVPVLLQIAAATGVYGISFVLVAVNVALAEGVGALLRREGLTRPVRAAAASAALCAACALLYGVRALATPPVAAGEPVSVLIVQGNLGAAARWGTEGGARTLDVYTRLTREALERAPAALVLWPESALTFFLEQDRLYGPALLSAFRDRDVELLVGAPRAAEEGMAPFFNSVYLVAPDGTLAGRYDKQYLLPFMEYFPLRLELARRRFGRIREFTPGAPTPPLATRAGRAGILVCNEAFLAPVAARRVADGAAYLVNPSNDSWVPDAGFAWQQFDIAALRAVEQRRFLIRVSDSGPSGVVDPLGRVVAHTAPLARDVLRATVAPMAGRTLYGRVGDLFGVLCVLAALAGLGRR